MHERISHLPLVTLYLTERCNSRCASCDYWRHGREEMDLRAVERLLPSLRQLRTQTVLISGGEPLLHRDWAAIAALLRAEGIEAWLLTSGLALAKHARRAAHCLDAITVSLDATDAKTYAAIRGVDAFAKVCEGIQASAAEGLRPGIRVTLQRANFHQLSRFIDLAKELGARDVSFLAVDVASRQAFGRSGQFASNLALRPHDLPLFEEILASAERDHAEDFRSGFIAESPHKLRRLLQYFAALLGQAAYPKVRCNAPQFSAVVTASGQVQPCFFIGGPAEGCLSDVCDLSGVLNGGGMGRLRAAIDRGQRAECRTCVCSLWRDPSRIAGATLMRAEPVG